MAIRNQYAPRREADPGAILSLRQQALDQQAELELLRMEQANRARRDSQRFALLQQGLGQDFARDRDTANFEQRRQLAAEADARHLARDEELRRRGLSDRQEMVEWQYGEEARQRQETLNNELDIIEQQPWTEEEKDAARQRAYAKAGDPRERPVIRRPQHPSGHEPGTFFYDDFGSLMTVQQDGNVKQLKPGLQPKDIADLYTSAREVLTRQGTDGEGNPIDIPPTPEEIEAWVRKRVQSIVAMFRQAPPAQAAAGAIGEQAASTIDRLAEIESAYPDGVYPPEVVEELRILAGVD